MTSGPDEFSHRDRCAIVGIGATDFSKDSGRSPLTLAAEASLAALRDCGLSTQDVDGIVRCDYDSVTPHALAAALGMKTLNYWGDSGPGGVGPCMMLGLAIGAIMSGQATKVLVIRSLNGRSGTRLGTGSRRITGSRVGGNGTYDELYLPYGLVAAGQVFAMLAQRHMIDFGTTREQLGAVALTCRENANRTRHAQLRDRSLTLDEYFSARTIASPLGLFDYCLETDGACAIVVTSAARANDCPKHPVLVRAVAGATAPDRRPGVMFPLTTRDDITDMPVRHAAELLWKRAGLGPSDVDVGHIYDCFTISVLLQLEAFGFCKRGESGAFAASGAIRHDGSLPINPCGGHMSGGYIHGMNHFIEAVKQLRGEADLQIDGAEVALVTGAPQPLGSGVVLRRA
jgi:acetyl-CoA acetyltransferase